LFVGSVFRSELGLKENFVETLQRDPVRATKLAALRHAEPLSRDLKPFSTSQLL
jgi:hypothetical protein